jgi:hypothetical protein
MEAMVLLFVILSAATASPPPLKVQQQARVSITILQAHRASQASWDPATRPNQREMMQKEQGGAEVRLRLTEFE